jgi:hypothetical protein
MPKVLQDSLFVDLRAEKGREREEGKPGRDPAWVKRKLEREEAFLSKPFFLALDIGGIKFFVGFQQVYDPFDQTDEPDNERSYPGPRGENGYEEHDDALLGITEIKFVNPEGSQEDSQNTGDDPVFAANARTAFSQAHTAFDA